jgi:cardiolipin synthase
MQVQWDQFIGYYFLYFLGGLAILMSVIHMLYRRRSPISMTAWLLLMIIAPYFFVLFYLLFGIRKRVLSKEKSTLSIEAKDEHPPIHPIDALLRNNGLPPSTQDNTIRFYTDGIGAYQALYNAFKSAQHSISISTYALKNDAVTQELFDLLIHKAKAGVDVRILTDAFGSRGIYFWQFPLKRLKDAGVQVSFFMPLFALPLHYRFNLRYHRKIYLIDNEVLFSGGMNLSQEYMGPEPVKERWMDLLYRCEGSLVRYYVDVFESDWAFSQHKAVSKSSTLASLTKGEAKLQAIPSGADIRNDALLEVIIYAIHKATKRIWIVTPYFLPDESILQALQIAKHRGVDVRLITPKSSDHFIADLGRSSYLRELQESDIKVSLYEASMLHAKAILFDDDTAIFGSLNLDERSLLLNYEIVTIAYSKEQIDQIDKWMKELLKHCTSEIMPAGKLRRIFENLMRIFVPQL